MAPLENGDPDRIGRYRLIGRLGAGGMGQVYFGRSAGGRAVAIKRIHPHMATDPSFRERFAREVAAARQVSGAFTAPVIDADTEGEVPWLVTSYVPALPLDEGVRAHGGLPEHSLRVLAAGLAEALNDIHRVGLIHRDLKPGNVLLAEDGPRVIDFGIARATEGTAATQSVIGTPGFMSPEQVQGERMTPVSDMFALGAVLVYAASGTGPFGEGAMPTMVMRIMQREPDISAVPASLQRIVSSCLAKEARLRPGPTDLLDALGDVPAGGSWLPPAYMQGVHEQVNKVNTALSEAPGEGGTADSGGRTSVLGSAAAGAAGGAVAGSAAGEALGDEDTTQQAGNTPAETRALGDDRDQTAHYPGSAPPGQTRPRSGEGAPPTMAYGQPPSSAAPSGDDPYSDLYRGPRQEQSDPRYQQQGQQYRGRQSEQRREEERRKQEEERVHQERVRAEQRAARQAQAQARRSAQPSLWNFVKLLPLLVLPILQIPLGYGASYAWQWFTTTQAWSGASWYFGDPFTTGAFFHAMFLGYFLLNNAIGLEYLVRSLRTGFVTGVVLAGAVIAATNGILLSYGFFG
ncbi:serine/threonine protein kinase [Haloactinospora alba]|uniref:non-specific serine/threonine protein kinase n=1 Tax=Haloactinospora alba TaxID=405555 RepID=A0A543NIW6_9ACTN|nr:serine/threonine-protein kinase [Haloactinospora alba]TQN31766.1 serine/threonine protein kinase [Haloactinospora alba]